MIVLRGVVNMLRYSGTPCLFHINLRMMWQKLLLVSALGIALDCASLRAGTDAEILFTLNGEPVSVGEFKGYSES